jgi:hypothetical protein
LVHLSDQKPPAQSKIDHNDEFALKCEKRGMNKADTEKMRGIIAAIKEGNKGIDLEALKKCNEIE